MKPSGAGLLLTGSAKLSLSIASLYKEASGTR